MDKASSQAGAGAGTLWSVPRPAARGQRTRPVRSQQGGETRTQIPPLPLGAPALLATPAGQNEPGETEAVQTSPTSRPQFPLDTMPGQHASQESFPAPALGQGGSEEAEQHALCYTKFPTETMLVLAHIPFSRLNPPPIVSKDRTPEPPPPPRILGSCRFGANKQLSTPKGQGWC